MTVEIKKLYCNTIKLLYKELNNNKGIIGNIIYNIILTKSRLKNYYNNINYINTYKNINVDIKRDTNKYGSIYK